MCLSQGHSCGLEELELARANDSRPQPPRLLRPPTPTRDLIFGLETHALFDFIMAVQGAEQTILRDPALL